MSTNITVSPGLMEALGIFYHDAQRELLTRMDAFGYKNATINVQPNEEPSVIKIDDGSSFVASFKSAGCVNGVGQIDLELTRS